MERFIFTLIVGILAPWLCFRLAFELVSTVAPGSLNLLLPSMVVLSFAIPLITLKFADLALQGFERATLARRAPLPVA